MLNQERTFTPSEAAVVSGVPVKTVHREIGKPSVEAKERSTVAKVGCWGYNDMGPPLCYDSLPASRTRKARVPG